MPRGAAGRHCTGESEAFQKSHDALTPASHPKCADDTTPNNRPMAAVAGLDDRTGGVGGTITVDVTDHFTDPDGDTLTNHCDVQLTPAWPLLSMSDRGPATW